MKVPSLALVTLQLSGSVFASPTTSWTKAREAWVPVDGIRPARIIYNPPTLSDTINRGAACSAEVMSKPSLLFWKTNYKINAKCTNLPEEFKATTRFVNKKGQVAATATVNGSGSKFSDAFVEQEATEFTITISPS